MKTVALLSVIPRGLKNAGAHWLSETGRLVGGLVLSLEQARGEEAPENGHWSIVTSCLSAPRCRLLRRQTLKVAAGEVETLDV